MSNPLTNLELTDLLVVVVSLDVRQARKVRDMANARLRDLGATTPSPWHQPTAPLSQPACERCGEEGHSVREHEIVEGAELQRGLEAAVEFQRSQVGHGPDEEASDGL